jgi:hypothetical protein
MKGVRQPQWLAETLFHRIPPLDQFSPAGLLALGSTAGSRLPNGVGPISDWLSPCDRRPRLQRRDRHGFAPCSGMLDDLNLSETLYYVNHGVVAA